MIKFTSFPKIEQFRSTVRSVCTNASFIGLSDSGEPIYDNSITKPTITFTGTIKIHGTNAAVCTDGTNTWAQSRKNIITSLRDNSGFAFFSESNKELFSELFDDIYKFFNIDRKNTVCLFGEWCGEGIQKGVAVNDLDKMFVIFAIKVVSDDDEIDNYFVDYDDFILKANIPSKTNNKRVFWIQQFQTHSIDIDFNHPEEVQNKLIQLTEQVESECPVGKAFGVSGVGEGIVWHAFTDRGCLRFKVKGEKHSASKVKKLASVDPEKIASAKEFADNTVTENRLEQAIQEVFIVPGVEISKKQMGNFLSWIKSDIFTEEGDTLYASGLEPKDVVGLICKKAVDWFMKKYG